MGKMSKTVKAAWIVGILAIVATIISCFFNLLNDRNDTDKSVTSHKQSGGITARNITITDANVTINHYFDGKSPDEKRALEKSLLAKYPLGYALFAVDGKTIHFPPNDLSFERDFVIRWEDSKISKLEPGKPGEPGWIVFNPPQIHYKPTGNSVLGKFDFRIERTIGFTMPYPMLPSWTNAFFEVIDDKDSFAVLVLGFKE